MQIMGVSRESCARNPNAFGTPIPLISLVSPRSDEYIFQEVRIVHVKFVGIDPYYWSILLVQISNFPDILAAEDHVVVELIPEGGNGEFWAGEV
jgi:hypothetical protein